MIKKPLSLLLVISMIVTMLTFMAVNTSAYSKGDLNNDGKFNAMDSILMTGLILGEDVPALASQMGDINHDGKVNSIDQSFLNMVLVGSYLISDEAYKISKITLGGKDISEYSIVLPTDYPPSSYKENAEWAAETIQQYVEKACGVNLPITTNDAGPSISFVYDNNLGSEAFTIDAEDGEVVLSCGLARGPFYASVGFMKNVLGYNIYNKDVVVLRNEGEIDLPSGYTHTEGLNTPFKYRDAYTYSRLRDKGLPDAHSGYFKFSYVAHHNTGMWDGQQWINAPKYGFCYGPNRNHSTFLYVPNWPTRTDMPCYTNPENIKECTENVRKAVYDLIASGHSFDNGSMPMISISCDDTDAWCMCRTCKKVIMQYGEKSSTMMSFIQNVSDNLIGEFPKIEFWTLAYYATIRPPKNMKIPQNLYICFAPIGHCSNHLIDRRDCPESESIWNPYGDWLEGWTKLTDKIHIWWYQCNYYYMIFVVPNLREIYWSIQAMRDYGVSGVFTENEDTIVGFSDLFTYVISELTWNPDMTEEEYLEAAYEFCEDYYGARELVDILLEIGISSDNAKCWINCSKPIDMYDFDDLATRYDKLYTKLEELRTDITDKDQLDRFDRNVVSIESALLSAAHESYYVKGTADQKSVYESRYKAFYEWMNSHRDTVVLDHFYETDAHIPYEFDVNTPPHLWYPRVVEALNKK